MKTKLLLSRLSQAAFGLALIALLTALMFSILRQTNIAEQAGVISYVFLVIGVVLSFIVEIRSGRSHSV